MSRAAALPAGADRQRLVALHIADRGVIIRLNRDILLVNMPPECAYSTTDRAITACQPFRVLGNSESYIATMAGTFNHFSIPQYLAGGFLGRIARLVEPSLHDKYLLPEFFCLTGRYPAQAGIDATI